MSNRLNREEVVILGAGLAGLSAAYHLGRNYIIFEKERSPGGMARSIGKDGYTFDYDGHILHFRNEYAFKLVSEFLNGNMTFHNRNSWIYSNGIYTRYPFQANFYGLPKDIIKDCLLGLIRARFFVADFPAEKGIGMSGYTINFEEWIRATFGDGIAEHFMLPYNRKFWTVEPSCLTCEWLDGFVPIPDIEDAITGAISDNVRKYGYNSQFWYPAKGGISELVDAFTTRIRNLRLNKKAVTIDQYRHEIIFEDATIKRYKRLISTIPLPELYACLVNLPKVVREAFSKLKWTSIFVLNIGIKKESISERHWVYYPEEKFIFYRIGFPANFSDSLVPEKRSSIYIEVAYSDFKKIDRNSIISRIIKDLSEAGIIFDEKDVELYLPIDIKYGYIIYDSERERALEVIKDYLSRFDIYTIGRYGSWRYMSMEDVILEGKEIAEKLQV